MQYKFNAYGHPNILGMHKTTLEFTKDNELSLNGDCIVGVNADFELKEIKNFIENSNNKKISITIKTISKNKKIKDMILAELNLNFSDEKELVIRKTDFVSERTFATKANKAAFDLGRDLIGFLKEKKNKVSIIIENRK
mgnify:CR=1 FL=1